MPCSGHEPPPWRSEETRRAAMRFGARLHAEQHPDAAAAAANGCQTCQRILNRHAAGDEQGAPTPGHSPSDEADRAPREEAGPR